MCPALPTIHALDKDGHRFIRRACLEFIVCTLSLVATRAMELIGRGGLVAFHESLLPLKHLLCEFLVAFRKEFRFIQICDFFKSKLFLLKTIIESLILNVRIGVKIQANMSQLSHILILELGVLPVRYNIELLYLVDKRFIDDLLKLVYNVLR